MGYMPAALPVDVAPITGQLFGHVCHWSDSGLNSINPTVYLLRGQRLVSNPLRQNDLNSFRINKLHRRVSIVPLD